MTGAKFQIYRSKDGWRFRLKARNGRIVATGESHPSKANAERAALRLVALAAQAAVDLAQKKDSKP